MRVVDRIFGILISVLYKVLYINCIKLKGAANTIPFNTNIKNGTLFLDKGSYFRRGCSLNINSGSVNIGKNVFFNNNVRINCHDSIVFGDGTIVGENVTFYDHDHVVSYGVVSRKEFVTKEVLIGKNVWIGCNCVILKGVSIGDNCIIGAGSIITKDVKNNTKVIQKRSNVYIENV